MEDLSREGGRGGKNRFAERALEAKAELETAVMGFLRKNGKISVC